MLPASESAAPPPLTAHDFPYRMKDLCERSGLPRQVIHFYIQQGLLPQGHKTGRNMAYYGEAHLERLQLIRRLQHERFLPLKAIRALLDARDGSFSPAQRAFLEDVRGRLGGSLSPARGEDLSAVPVEPLIARLGVPRAELDRLVEMGLLGMRASELGELLIAGGDAWILETWGEIRALGFCPENGFGVEDISLYEEAVHNLFQREKDLLRDRLAQLDPALAARMIERVIPLLNVFLARYHTALVRNFFTGV